MLLLLFGSLWTCNKLNTHKSLLTVVLFFVSELWLLLLLLLLILQGSVAAIAFFHWAAGLFICYCCCCCFCSQCNYCSCCCCCCSLLCCHVYMLVIICFSFIFTLCLFACACVQWPILFACLCVCVWKFVPSIFFYFYFGLLCSSVYFNQYLPPSMLLGAQHMSNKRCTNASTNHLYVCMYAVKQSVMLHTYFLLAAWFLLCIHVGAHTFFDTLMSQNDVFWYFTAFNTNSWQSHI